MKIILIKSQKYVLPSDFAFVEHERSLIALACIGSQVVWAGGLPNCVAYPLAIHCVHADCTALFHLSTYDARLEQILAGQRPANRTIRHPASGHSPKASVGWPCENLSWLDGGSACASTGLGCNLSGFVPHIPDQETGCSISGRLRASPLDERVDCRTP